MTSVNADFHAPHTPQDSEFDRIEASFEAIESQHKLPHRRLLALDKIASYHGVPKGTFRRAFQLWLQSSTEGGQS